MLSGLLPGQSFKQTEHNHHSITLGKTFDLEMKRRAEIIETGLFGGLVFGPCLPFVSHPNDRCNSQRSGRLGGDLMKPGTERILNPKRFGLIHKC